jgi:hypothetical protein
MASCGAKAIIVTIIPIPMTKKIESRMRNSFSSKRDFILFSNFPYNKTTAIVVNVTTVGSTMSNGMNHNMN